LLAPKLTAESRVTFAGQSIGSDGRWHGHVKRTLVQPGDRGFYTFRMPAYSAAVIDLGKI
jgi:hypothetical protein